MNERRADLDLEVEDITKLYDNKVKGDTFLDLTRDDLLSIQIPLGPAKNIIKLISDIKGESKRTSFLSTLYTYFLCFLSWF